MRAHEAGRIVLSEMKKFKSFKELKRIIKKEKKIGKVVAWTNGAFDLIHVGHLRSLSFAKSQCDILVVGLNSDSSIRKYKSKLRPIISERQRAELLCALGMVDYVTIFSSSTAINAIRLLKPDVFVKGGDYAEEDLPEAEAVRSYGGKIVLGEKVPLISTTEIIRKVLEFYCPSRFEMAEAKKVVVSE